MSDELIRFVLEGAPARNGNIPAEVFVAKLRQFITTFYSFDRAFSKRNKRGLILEIADLQRINPSIVALRPQSQVKGYDAAAAADWTIRQFAQIHDSRNADLAVPQDALDNLIELSHLREKKIPSLIRMTVEYVGTSVNFDAAMEGNALVLRQTRQIENKRIWEAGISRGSLLGELRGVMDVSGERQFYIVPPSGSDQIQCLFAEAMRDQMNRNLFKVVRVHGYLRYDGTKPTPFLVEAEILEEIEPQERRLEDMYGAFKDLEMPDPGEFDDPRWS